MSKENNYSDLTRLDILLGELGVMVLRKHHKEALKCCDEILKLTHDEACIYYIWWYKGRIYTKMGLFKKAYDCRKKAIALDSVDAEIHDNEVHDLEFLANITYTKCYDTIKKRYADNKSKEVLEKSKNYALKTLDLCLNEKERSCFNKGWNYSDQKLYLDAINIYDRIISQCADVQFIHFKALVCKASCLFKLSKYEKALECCEKELELKPNDVDSLLSKAQCLFTLNRYEEVISCLDIVLKLDKCSELNKKWGLEYQAKAYFRLERYKEALEYYDKLLIITSSADSLRNKAICLMELNKFAEAFYVINEALTLAPQDILILHSKACCLSGLEKYEELLEVCNEIANNPEYKNDPQILEYKILALLKLERYDEAITCENNLLIMNINDTKVLGYKASTLYKLGQNAESIKYLERAIHLDPTNKELNIRLALSQTLHLESEGKIDKALIAINKVHELIPDNTAIMVYKARLCNAVGKYSEAIKYCNKVIDREPLFMDAWQEKGIACSKLGDEKEMGIMYSALVSKLDLLKSQNQKDATNLAAIVNFPTNIKVKHNSEI
ncbi:tetratricopeptide repeat protein [Candidatus Tisiphia endosymbiont of Ditula angustiorana]|uniref:tetratricopeptide repeat protein n=1 Tax=Candidatus Tisiphia endosymbiont of Ditula angustiorana TaxID=3066272 RepID=UPI00312CAB15